ncbi:[LSU ribosomal protein L11P]-lysine N-methyltransferase [Litoreibacter ponti]|uniref:Ribosomal protein L11 methyltransferase n=1 Tax=Litoreibacter ponti TaxID=1510457 RepID=A0A2T6BLJ7_9RHOB|nr:50S ribosomal protein L11 methyltransferase [Litoreibacter ponti]PTX56929.1 [LSU ribosomal protein L11P]-lysine N-methyltransferase [Litoreibacter ponti]
MPTYTALTTLMGEPAAQALGEALETLDPAPTGVGVFEVEDGSGLWEVGGYFLEPPSDIELALLAAAHDARPFVISEVPDQDWVAHVRRELAPVEAGRFFVYGSHDADKVPSDRIALLIEAAMAFGTGHHGTTQGCLLSFEDFLGEGGRARSVIDVGCGTAVLAMAAAAVWDETVIASDIDPVAVEVAEANAKANNMADKITCLEAVGFDHDGIAHAAPFDLIFANILKAPLIGLAPDMAAHAAPGGTIILSGLLVEQGDEVQGVYEVHGFEVSQRRDIGEWTALRMRKL